MVFKSKCVALILFLIFTYTHTLDIAASTENCWEQCWSVCCMAFVFFLQIGKLLIRDYWMTLCIVIVARATVFNIKNNVSTSLHRTMTAICFVCNLPIMSHQVGLVWSGGNGWDDLMREQVNFYSNILTFWSCKWHDDDSFLFRSANRQFGSVWAVDATQQHKSQVSRLQALRRRPIVTVDEVH